MSFSLGDHTYHKHDAYRLLLRIGTEQINVIQLTKKEYSLLLCLLQGGIHSDDSLMAALQYEKAQRRNLERVIDHLRLKLKSFQLNVVRVTKYGYTLLPTASQVGSPLSEEMLPPLRLLSPAEADIVRIQMRKQSEPARERSPFLKLPNESQRQMEDQEA